jgi:hypothetical protein
MARGLSPLQQQILRLVWERDETRHGPYRLIFPHDIFVQLYGWPLTYGAALAARDGDLTRYQSWYFRPSAIGEQRYHAAMVTVSRALGRLQSRGILERYKTTWSVGWGLTEEGRRIAQRLMVDKNEKDENNVIKHQPLSPLND